MRKTDLKRLVEQHDPDEVDDLVDEEELHERREQKRTRPPKKDKSHA